jgi:hypothetical protein
MQVSSCVPQLWVVNWSLDARSETVRLQHLKGSLETLGSDKLSKYGRGRSASATEP